MSRSTYVTKHNSWPTEHFEDGWKLSDRALGFPITSTEVGNRVRRRWRKRCLFCESNCNIIFVSFLGALFVYLVNRSQSSFLP